MNPPACLVCGNAGGNRILAAREKMNGTLDSFDYVQCAACGHLHLVTLPADLDAYYAKGYYSFHTRAIPRWRQWLACRPHRRPPGRRQSSRPPLEPLETALLRLLAGKNRPAPREPGAGCRLRRRQPAAHPATFRAEVRGR